MRIALMCCLVLSIQFASCNFDSKSKKFQGGLDKRQLISDREVLNRKDHSDNEDSENLGRRKIIEGDDDPSFKNLEDSDPRRLPESLTWKRYRAIETGLMAGLELTKTEVCTEFGGVSCIDQVYLSELGGNEPFTQVQYERIRNPTAMTAVALERVLLSACEQRWRKDKALADKALIFKFLAENPSSIGDNQIKMQTNMLYQRLLARDAKEVELNGSLEVAKVVSGADKLAIALCLLVGSHIENIFL